MIVNVDKEKIERMVRHTLHGISGQGAHPGEVILALSECVGRVIVTIEGDGILKRELVDLAIKQMAQAIEAGIDGRIIQ